MPTLTEKQMTIAGYLADGMSQHEAARRSGVARSTIQRYLTQEAFAAEVERRRVLRIASTEEVIAAIEEDSAQEWIGSIKSHIEAIDRAAQLSQAGGFNAITKALRRLKDLPDESLKPSDAIALLKAGQDLLDASFAWREEVMGLHEIAERVTDAKEA